MYKNYLFDLDGTLLPMDMKQFVELFTASFSRQMASVTGIESKSLMNAIWAAVATMSRNDGSCLNEDLFWRSMNHSCRRDMRAFSGAFDDYYHGAFAAARAATSVQPLAAVCVEHIRKSGGRLIVATNPIFPKSATYTRIKWAGLNVNDFSYITTYDNSSACKPNLNYYEEICSVCGIRPEESIVIGNDVDEDMVASRLGFDAFLVTDCLLNRSGKDVRLFRRGSFADFYDALTRDAHRI